MADVFVSYASEDRDRVRPLVEAIEAAGFSVWWDRRIDLGSSFDREIESEIDQARCVVVLWSEWSVKSDWVRNEAQEGLDRGILVPIKFDDVRPPLAFRRIQTAELMERPSREEIAPILSAIQNVCRSAAQSEHLHHARAQFARAKSAEHKRRPSRIFLSLLVMASLAAAGLWLLFQEHGHQDSRDTLTIGVLPLVSLSNDPAQGQFVSGVTREIWNGIKRVEGVQLVAQTSSNRFAESILDVREIASELNADYIIEGSVLRNSENVRIDFSLIDGNTGTSAFSQQYERHVTDVDSLFEIYDEISYAVGEVFGRFVAGSSNPTDNLSAYIAYDRAHWAQKVNEKINLLEQALDLDPDFLDARAELAFRLIEAAEQGFATEPRRVFQRARAEARRVLFADPKHGWATLALGRTYLQLEVDARLAMDLFNEAANLGAYLPAVAIYRAATLVNTGEYLQAEKEMRAAYRLDPQNSDAAEFLARCLYLQRNVGEAWRLFDVALELDPRPSNAFIFALLSAVAEKDVVRARSVLRKLPENSLPDIAEPFVSLLEGDTQPLADLLAAYETLRETGGYVPALRLAYGYWWLQDFESHIRWFEIREREQNNLYFVNFDIAMMPGYWERLRAWATAEPGQESRRLKLLSEHRSRIEQMTSRMVL